MANLNVIPEYKSKSFGLKNDSNEEFTLRPVALEDTKLMMQWRREKKQFYLQQKMPSEEQWRGFLKKNYVESDKDFMFIMENNEIPFGQISLYNIENEGAEYGRIIRGLEGVVKGAFNVATKELLRFGFEEVGFDRIHLCALADNFRAKELYRDCGFINCEGDIPLEYKDKTWVEKPELEGKAKKFLTNMEITKERFGYLISEELFY